MYREVLNTLSLAELQENEKRLLLTVEELEYCFDVVCEEKDELISSNDMLKNTVYGLMELKGVCSSKDMQKMLYGGVTKGQEKAGDVKSDLRKKKCENAPEVEEKKEEKCVSQIISEEISLPKSLRLSEKGLRSELAGIPKLLIGKNRSKKHSK
jgi:hypothetical protein